MTLIDKINHFESLDKQTVKEFNKLFTTCPISGIVDENALVEIGEIADTSTTRFLTVGNTLVIKHRFVPVEETEVDVNVYNRGETKITRLLDKKRKVSEY